MIKFIWIGKFFIHVAAANELFYTTSKSGSRAYYLFRIGFNKYKINDKRVITMMIDVPFIEVGFGKILSINGKEK